MSRLSRLEWWMVGGIVASLLGAFLSATVGADVQGALGFFAASLAYLVLSVDERRLP